MNRGSQDERYSSEHRLRSQRSSTGSEPYSRGGDRNRKRDGADMTSSDSVMKKERDDEMETNLSAIGTSSLAYLISAYSE